MAGDHRAEQMGMIPTVRRGVDGWTVTKDGKTLKVESRQEAVELAYSGLSDYEFQSAASMAQAADEFANLGGGRAEAFEISMSQRSVQQEVDVGRVTPEQAAESVQVFAQMHGLTAEEARAETLAVLGNNKSEMVEGVRTAISRIFGGGNIVTVLHEGVHGRWRMGLSLGITRHSKGWPGCVWPKKQVAWISSRLAMTAKSRRKCSMKQLPKWQAPTSSASAKIPRAISHPA